MKKFLISAFVLTTGMMMMAANAPAQNTKTQCTAAKAQCTQPQPDPLDKWTFCQLGVFPGIPSVTKTSNVYGIKSGWPICCGHGRVFGVEASWFLSGTDYAHGVQASWVACNNLEGNGIQASFVFVRSQKVMTGLQASLCLAMSNRVYGLEASSVNLSGDVDGMQAAALVNVSGDITGFQTAVFLNKAKNATGLQISLINKAEENTGLQFGLINVAKHGGVQMGLVNYIKDSQLPFFPVINICF